jgi:hypothetical protein
MLKYIVVALMSLILVVSATALFLNPSDIVDVAREFEPSITGMANANLFVSADNSQFDDYFSGPQVIEVVVIDPDIQDTDDAAPDVTINGKALRMNQAADGNWYSYFADTDVTSIADSQFLNYEDFTASIQVNDPDLDTSDDTTPIEVQLTPLYSTGNVVVNYNQGGGVQTTTLTFDTVDQFAGAELDTSEYPAGSQVHASVADLWLNVDPTDEDSWDLDLNQPVEGTGYQFFSEDRTSSGNQIAISADHKTTLELQVNYVVTFDEHGRTIHATTVGDAYDLFNDEENAILELSIPSTGTHVIILEDLVDEDAPSHSGVVSFDSDSYKIADTVTITLEDLDLNVDSDLIDIFTVVAPDEAGDTVTATGLILDSGNLLDITFDDDIWKSDITITTGTGASTSAKAVTGLQDGVPITITEIGPNSGVFGTYDESDDSVIRIPDGDKRGTSATIDYHETPATILVGFDFASLDIQIVDDEWRNGEEIKVILIDHDGDGEVIDLEFTVTDSQPISIEDTSRGYTIEGTQIILEFNDGVDEQWWDSFGDEVVVEKAGDLVPIIPLLTLVDNEVIYKDPAVSLTDTVTGLDIEVNYIDFRDASGEIIEVTDGDTSQFEGTIDYDTSETDLFSMTFTIPLSSDQEDAPSHSGVVSFDSDSYKIADTVTITLEDGDLNVDGDLIDIFTVVNPPDESTGGTGGLIEAFEVLLDIELLPPENWDGSGRMSSAQNPDGVDISVKKISVGDSVFYGAPPIRPTPFQAECHRFRNAKEVVSGEVYGDGSELSESDFQLISPPVDGPVELTDDSGDLWGFLNFDGENVRTYDPDVEDLGPVKVEAEVNEAGADQALQDCKDGDTASQVLNTFNRHIEYTVIPQDPVEAVTQSARVAGHTALINSIPILGAISSAGVTTRVSPIAAASSNSFSFAPVRTTATVINTALSAFMGRFTSNSYNLNVATNTVSSTPYVTLGGQARQTSGTVRTGSQQAVTTRQATSFRMTSNVATNTNTYTSAFTMGGFGGYQPQPTYNIYT